MNGSTTSLVWSSGTLGFLHALTINPNASPTSTASIFGSALTLSSNKTLTAASESIGNPISPASFLLSINSGGTNSIAGGLSVSYLSTINVSGGTLTMASTTVSQTGRIHYMTGTFSPGAFNINNGGQVTLSGQNVLFVLGNLSIDSTSKLDLSQNRLVIHNGDLSQIQPLLARGYSNGSWTGNGLGFIQLKRSEFHAGRICEA